MRTHLVEGDEELLDSASSVSLVDAGEKDSTTKSTFTSFSESPYWKFRYIRDIIRSSDLIMEEFMLKEQLKIRRRVLFHSVVECLEFRCRQSFGRGFEA
ncbi:hypothetical protein H5410_035333 [Solanum commersonii]|uniref:Uncharacterized protein n=1 Tax=Solanum commersonii TaxID=4109 RepID=A0A9J5Y1K9_SOLCO|nr:hypothetical protein H5410_035333 [Solanum commersonii]